MSFSEVITGITFLISFILGVAYIILGMAAYSHTVANKPGDKMAAAGPWWAFSPSVYDEAGKSYCKSGRTIALIAIGSGVMFYLVR